MHAQLISVGLIFVCLVVSAPVYRCADGEQVSYQSLPCDEGRTAKLWDALALPTQPSQAAVKARQIQPPSRPRHAAPLRRAGRTAKHAGAPLQSPCDQAKAQRAAAYEQAGLKRSFQLSSQWDNRVQRACR